MWFTSCFVVSFQLLMGLKSSLGLGLQLRIVSRKTGFCETVMGPIF